MLALSSIKKAHQAALKEMYNDLPSYWSTVITSSDVALDNSSQEGLKVIGRISLLSKITNNPEATEPMSLVDIDVITNVPKLPIFECNQYDMFVAQLDKLEVEKTPVSNYLRTFVKESLSVCVSSTSNSKSFTSVFAMEDTIMIVNINLNAIADMNAVMYSLIKTRSTLKPVTYIK